MMSGQISVRHATRTGRVVKVIRSPVLSVSETVGDADVAAGVWMLSGCEVAVGGAVVHPASSSRTKPGIAYFITPHFDVLA